MVISRQVSQTLLPHEVVLYLQSQVHPFTPIPLFLCASFFMTHRALDDSFDLQLQVVLKALQDLQRVNCLAQNYLDFLELESVSQRGGLFSYEIFQ